LFDFIELFKSIFVVVFSYFYCKYSRSSVIFKLPVIYSGNQVIRIDEYEPAAHESYLLSKKLLVPMTSQTAPDWQLQIGESGASSRYNFNLELERLVCKQTALAA
jgi:hypothetical protein